jgi:hypothetical protein
MTRSETYPQRLPPTNAPTYLVCILKGQLFVGVTRILRRYWWSVQVDTPKVRSTSMQASMSAGVKRRCRTCGRSNGAFFKHSFSLMFSEFFSFHRFRLSVVLHCLRCLRCLLCFSGAIGLEVRLVHCPSRISYC